MCNCSDYKRTIQYHSDSGGKTNEQKTHTHTQNWFWLNMAIIKRESRNWEKSWLLVENRKWYNSETQNTGEILVHNSWPTDQHTHTTVTHQEPLNLPTASLRPVAQSQALGDMEKPEWRWSQQSQMGTSKIIYAMPTVCQVNDDTTATADSRRLEHTTNMLAKRSGRTRPRKQIRRLGAKEANLSSSWWRGSRGGSGRHHPWAAEAKRPASRAGDGKIQSTDQTWRQNHNLSLNRPTAPPASSWVSR